MRRSSASLLFVICIASCLAPAVADAPARILAYDLKPGQPLRYKLTAQIKASMPLFDSPTPIDIDALIKAVYVATPKTLLADGTSDVDFKVESIEIELNKFPFPVALEDFQGAFNLSAAMERTGLIKKVTGGGTLPFNISIPGFDPTRLYSLIFPVVFQTRPVKTGDTWSFKSELLGGDSAKPAFTATVLKPEDGTADYLTRIKETFRMDVDQKLDDKKKPVTGATPIYRTRKGKIDGDGVLNFDSRDGRFTHSVVNLSVNMQDDLLGKPSAPDEPKQVISKVDARITVDYESAEAAAGRAAEAAKKDK